MTVRLAIVCTHPVQYFVPVFRALAAKNELDVRVFYGWRGATEIAYDPGFEREIVWDVPLLDGYDYEFVTNVSKDQGSHRFLGIDLPDLPTRITAWKADAILVYGWCYRAHLAVMRHFKGRLPIFFRGDSTLLDEARGIRKYCRRALLRWVYRSVDCVFSVGTNNRRYFLAHGLQSDQITFAPHAVDDVQFATASVAQVSEVRRQFQIPRDHLVFMFVGKLERKKAPDILLRAWENILDEATHLIFVGSGPLERQIRESPLPRTHSVGFRNQSELAAYYSASDLVILPSRGPGETWGLVLNEAMACGRAVVASDKVGAAVDLVEDGVNGWIVAANSVSALSDALQQAIGKGKLGLRSMGERSRQIIDCWTIPIQADAIARTVCGYVERRQAEILTSDT